MKKRPAVMTGGLLIAVLGAAAVVTQTQGPADQIASAEVRFWVARSLAILGHSAVVLGLLFVGIFHYREADTGVAMATASRALIRPSSSRCASDAPLRRSSTR